MRFFSRWQNLDAQQPSWRRYMALILVVLLATTHSAIAQAKSDPPAEVKELTRQGNDNYELGKFQDALELYERAYRLHKAPLLLFNLAQCHRQLGHHREALFLY